jgi:hypothetical protein
LVDVAPHEVSFTYKSLPIPLSTSFIRAISFPALCYTKKVTRVLSLSMG